MYMAWLPGSQQKQTPSTLGTNKGHAKQSGQCARKPPLHQGQRGVSPHVLARINTQEQHSVAELNCMQPAQPCNCNRPSRCRWFSPSCSHTCAIAGTVNQFPHRLPRASASNVSTIFLCLVKYARRAPPPASSLPSPRLTQKGRAELQRHRERQYVDRHNRCLNHLPLQPS